jgi:ATP-dependent metalloprotease
VNSCVPVSSIDRLYIDRFMHAIPQDPSSPLLRSDRAFQLYLTSLLKNGLESSINSAVRRRESLLASSAAGQPPSSETNDRMVVEDVPSSKSQQIAQAVLASGLITNASDSHSPSSPSAGIPGMDINKLAAALRSGAGVSGNPLHVSISEREVPSSSTMACPDLWR